MTFQGCTTQNSLKSSKGQKIGKTRMVEKLRTKDTAQATMHQ